MTGSRARIQNVPLSHDREDAEYRTSSDKEGSQE